MLSQDVERYVDLQRTLGYKFGDQSCSLRLFAAYAMSKGDEFVGVERVLAWAAVQTASAQRRCTLIARVRRFALAMHAENQRHEVPPRACVGHAKRVRRPPHIYTADEIGRIMRVTPSQINLAQVDSPLVLAFLTDIEKSRGNTARTRNARLAAIKSFFRYLEYREPLHIEQGRQIHGIPLKKMDEGLVAYLTRQEIQALLDAPNASTAFGSRDRAMLHVAYACGLRVAELVSLRLDQLDGRAPASIRVMGKGRRERVLPLWKETTATINAWIQVRQANGAPELFHNAGGRAMTRAGFEYILDKHVSTAGKQQPSIVKKRVTPHVLRHSCAMHILQVTGDIRKVSLWLGHASIQSTEIYLRADPTEKLDALAMGIPPALKRGKFKAPDKLLAMFKEVGKGG